MNILKRIVTGLKSVGAKIRTKIAARKKKPQDVGGITITGTPKIPTAPTPVSQPKPTPGPVPPDRERFGVTWDIIDKAQIRALRYSDLSPWERRYFNTEEKKTRISGGSPQQWVQDFWADHLYAEMYPEGEAVWNDENSKLIIWVIRTLTTDGRVFGVDADGNWGWGIAK